MVKNLPANAGRCKRPGLDHWVETIPWRSSPGNPSQYSCLENPMDRGAWWAAIHGAAKSQTRLERVSSSSGRDAFASYLSIPFYMKLPPNFLNSVYPDFSFTPSLLAHTLLMYSSQTPGSPICFLLFFCSFHKIASFQSMVNVFCLFFSRDFVVILEVTLLKLELLSFLWVYRSQIYSSSLLKTISISA